MLARRWRLAFLLQGLVLAIHPLIAVSGLGVLYVFLLLGDRRWLYPGLAGVAILVAAARRELEVAEYTPSEIKNAVVGTGKATKEQVQFMVKKLLRLKEVPTPADAADGVAVALCHLNTGRLQRLASAATGGR